MTLAPFNTTMSTEIKVLRRHETSTGQLSSICPVLPGQWDVEIPNILRLGLFKSM